jgi:LuxR family maltose regulon positive regulatory protein
MPRAKQYNTKSLYFPNRINKAMDGIPDYPLTILEAPMGYGKTTAVMDARRRNLYRHTKRYLGEVIIE